MWEVRADLKLSHLDYQRSEFDELRGWLSQAPMSGGQIAARFQPPAILLTANFPIEADATALYERIGHHLHQHQFQAGSRAELFFGDARQAQAIK